MKKLLSLGLILCMLLCTACGTSTPRDALKADMEAAKSSPEEIIGDIGETGFGKEATSALVDKVLDFDYEVFDEKIDGNTATVETTITTYPFGEIFGNVVADLFAEALSGKEMTTEEAAQLMDQSLLDRLDEAEKSYKTTVSITLIKEGDNWIVQESDEMSNALTGGLLDFISQSSNSAASE